MKNINPRFWIIGAFVLGCINIFLTGLIVGEIFFDKPNPAPEPVINVVCECECCKPTEEEIVPDIPEPEIDIPEEPKPESTATDEEIELICLVTMAEAGNQPEEGVRLVIDTILNRRDHEAFPDTVHDVLYQKNQFSTVSNGRIHDCYVRDDIYQLVIEELNRRTNHEVVFFRSGQYGRYGTPLFKVGDHYFSKYK